MDTLNEAETETETAPVVTAGGYPQENIAPDEFVVEDDGDDDSDVDNVGGGGCGQDMLKTTPGRALTKDVVTAGQYPQQNIAPDEFVVDGDDDADVYNAGGGGCAQDMLK
eukprot:CAMPEP_0202717038 /NCGR_PEP_ID=MMETSP1385-20130828/107349_1 /ASSEMBLY_ACC=CAM_ASM_000861 /TAXON_ID=933848 /ORGANISM="Elphidium margaritaceum" /LENGTH=109 /DNA_ID=CAMNT_0049379065 /DNA_START=28 /DNA_END=354 /DNA_ORIENTATION=-